MSRNKRLVKWDESGREYVNYDENIEAYCTEVREQIVDLSPVGWLQVLKALHQRITTTVYVHNTTNNTLMIEHQRLPEGSASVPQWTT